MRVKFKDRILEVTPRDEEVVVSPFTGKELRSFLVDITVNNSSLEIFEELLDYVEEKGAFEIDSEGNQVKSYSVRNSSSSYISGGDVREYTLEFKEKEEVKADKLIIEGVELYPHEYKESYDEGAIILSAKVKITSAIRKQINEATSHKQYFDVIREGVSNETKKMRFGTNLWSKHDDDTIKLRIVLVEKGYDERPDKDEYRGFNYPEIGNMQEMIVYAETYLEKLTDLLISKEMLNTEEVEKLKQETKEEMGNKYISFYQVQDVDKEPM